MTCMARALASSGLTSGIPMATCGRWFSPSRLRDLLAIIIPMIEAPNRFNRQRSHQRGEQVRTNQTTGDGHIGAKLDHSRHRADCLPPMLLPNNDCKKEKKFCQSFCVILLLGTARGAGAKGLNKGVPTEQA